MKINKEADSIFDWEYTDEELEIIKSGGII